jgi:two-component system, sensor histidine kinase
MSQPPVPFNEELRQSAVQKTRLLDSMPEERFDRLTRIACHLFRVPIALVTLVDRKRQWFKSRQGLDVSETPRSASFCAYAVAMDELLEVPDAQHDWRFAANPLVTGHPFIRFYAGMPIRDYEGYPLGTICLIDRQPRNLSAEERDLLRDLARCVEQEVNHMDLYEALAHLQLAQGERERAYAARSDFFASMDHRIRSPMTGLLGLIDLMAEEPLSASQLALMEHIRQAADSVCHSTTSVLDWAQIESGTLQVETMPFDVRRLIDGVISARSLLASQRRLAMTSTFSGATPKWVTGDARRVALVLGHLLDNAMAHASAGRIEVAVDTHAAGVGYMSMTFSVKDTGCGMDNHHQLRILSTLEGDVSFKEADGPAAGLGLALSSRLANAMGGRLWFDSREGGGSTFGFSIRCSSDPVNEAALKPVTRSGGLRVLVMEEHPATRSTYAACLSRAGMETTAVASSREAIDICSHSTFDLIILDGQLRDMDRFALIEAMVGPEPRKSRLLMLTSSPSAKDMFECESLGVHGYHAKGISGESLIAAVVACMDPHPDRMMSVSAQS